ncbi:MAG: hypothetical protein HUU19_03460 [Phycisphaerales bacterium]|nr:hypothetical protein [Phycisphaerales bacterium]
MASAYAADTCTNAAIHRDDTSAVSPERGRDEDAADVDQQTLVPTRHDQSP